MHIETLPVRFGICWIMSAISNLFSFSGLISFSGLFSFSAALLYLRKLSNKGGVVGGCKMLLFSVSGRMRFTMSLPSGEQHYYFSGFQVAVR